MTEISVNGGEVLSYKWPKIPSMPGKELNTKHLLASHSKGCSLIQSDRSESLSLLMLLPTPSPDGLHFLILSSALWLGVETDRQISLTMQKSVTGCSLGPFPTQNYHPALVLESQRFCWLWTDSKCKLFGLRWCISVCTANLISSVKQRQLHTLHP